MIRRNLTPPLGASAGLPPTRRGVGGARRNVSYRVTLFRDGIEMSGWALNISRGGLRAVVEERVELGEELGISIAEEQLQRRGRVVWTQEEPDGTIIGISFFERLERAPSGVELDSSTEIAPSELAKKLGMTEQEFRSTLEKATEEADHDEAPSGPDREAKK